MYLDSTGQCFGKTNCTFWWNWWTVPCANSTVEFTPKRTKTTTRARPMCPKSVWTERGTSEYPKTSSGPSPSPCYRPWHTCTSDKGSSTGTSSRATSSSIDRARWNCATLEFQEFLAKGRSSRHLKPAASRKWSIDSKLHLTNQTSHQVHGAGKDQMKRRRDPLHD